MIKERRRHPRLRIPLEAEYLVAGEAEWREGTIWTLGAGGAALLCEEELQRGALLEGLHFVLAAEGDLPETRIEVGAEVVSRERKGDFGRPSNFMLGLRFMDLGEQEFELLRQFVFRRLTGPRHVPDDAESEPQERTGSPPIEIRFKLFDEFVEEVSENLSPTGMFIRAHRPLPPGSRFVFQFQLGDDFSLFRGTAEVVWTRRRSEDPQRPPGMGVRFLKLDLTSQKMVGRLVGQRETGGSPDGDDAVGRHRPAVAPRAALRLSEDPEPFAMQPEPPALNGGEPGPDAAEAATEPKKSNASASRPSRRTKRLEERLGKAEAARDKAQEHLSLLGDEADSLREKIGALESAHEEAEAARAKAEAEAAELRGELRVREPQGDLQEELRKARKELEHRQAQWERKELEIQEELERRSANETELQERVERACETEAELVQRLEQAEGGRKELEQLLEQSAETENELERVRLESEEARQEWRAVEAELQLRLEEKGAAEAELRQRLEKLEGRQAEMEEQLERAEGTKSELERVRLEAEETAKDWQAGEAELRARCEQREASEAELEQRLEEAVSQKTELRRQLDELGQARGGLEQRLEQSKAVEVELREQARELRADRAGLEKRLALAADQMGGIRRLAEEMKSRLNGGLSGGLVVEGEFAATLDEVAKARSGLDETVDALAAAHGSLGERLARVTEAWSSLESGVAQITLEAVYNDEPPAPGRSVPPAAEPEEVAAALGETSEPAFREPEIEDGFTETVAAAPEPAPTGAARLVDAARRAVARLGFGRASAANGNGGDPGPDPRLVPADEMESATHSGAPDPLGIEETVRAWAAAWSEQRVEDYLSFYSQEFEPEQREEADDSGEATHAWLPPLAGMEATLGPISQVELAAGRYAVQFEQSVETDSYTRRTGRTLEMVREADAWKIAAESFQDL